MKPPFHHVNWFDVSATNWTILYRDKQFNTILGIQRGYFKYKKSFGLIKIYLLVYRLLINSLSKNFETQSTLGLVTYYWRESSPLSEQKVSEEVSREWLPWRRHAVWSTLCLSAYLCFISQVHSIMLPWPIKRTGF